MDDDSSDENGAAIGIKRIRNTARHGLPRSARVRRMLFCCARFPLRVLPEAESRKTELKDSVWLALLMQLILLICNAVLRARRSR